jgi:hypothetical protein
MPAEDLSLNHIVNTQFDKAAAHLRTAAYVSAIGKIGRAYLELGVFP